MASKVTLGALNGATGAKVVVAQPLVGAERDEIANLVMRLKRADERARRMETKPDGRPAPSSDELKWAEDWKLPSEVFEYFVLDHAA